MTNVRQEEARAFREKVGRRIAEGRKRCSMSQEQLAERAGVRRLQILKYEAGEHQPSPLVLVKIGEALGLTLEELVAP